MADSVSRRKWTDLAPQRTFKHHPEFAELYRFVLAYFNSKPGEFMAPDAGIRELREHLQFVEKSRLFNDPEVGANLSIPQSTAYRFIGGSRPTYATFETMMNALADQYGIKDRRFGQKEPLYAETLPASGEPALKMVRVEAQEALDQLLDALDGMIPTSQYTTDLNRAPVDLTPDQYALLIATVRSAQAFSELETWDRRAIRIIRSLNEILLELDKLLATATNVVSKRLRNMLKGVAAMLKRVADAIVPSSD